MAKFSGTLVTNTNLGGRNTRNVVSYSELDMTDMHSLGIGFTDHEAAKRAEGIPSTPPPVTNRWAIWAFGILGGLVLLTGAIWLTHHLTTASAPAPAAATTPATTPAAPTPVIINNLPAPVPAAPAAAATATAPAQVLHSVSDPRGGAILVNPDGHLDFVPNGAKGDKGDKGDAGPAGPTGPVGARGSRGLIGPQGTPGAQGLPATGTVTVAVE